MALTEVRFQHSRLRRFGPMILRSVALGYLAFAALQLGFAQNDSAVPVSVVVDSTAQTTPFPHFWEQTFGSGGPYSRCGRVIGTTSER